MLAQAKLSLLSGEIAEFPSPDGQNSSYSLDFRGPQVSCETTAQNITVPGRLEDPWILFNTTWFGAQLIVQHTEFFGWYVSGIAFDYQSFAITGLSLIVRCLGIHSTMKRTRPTVR